MTDQQERLGIVLLLLFLIWYFFMRDDNANAMAGYVPPNYNRFNMATRTDSTGCKTINTSKSFAQSANIAANRVHNVVTCCAQPTIFKP